MPRFSRVWSAILLGAGGLLGTREAAALPIKEWLKYPPEKRAVYITGAVSMTAYTYASNGNTAKARCIQSWYFGQKGVETPGPSALALELGAAELQDASKLHVEGVILGLTDKVCGADTAKAKQ